MYYEDTDLCFEARARGLRVLYEPPGSRGPRGGGDRRDATSSAATSATRRATAPKFVEKWRERLEPSTCAPGPRTCGWRPTAARRPRVLVVDHRVPMWDRDSGSLRMRGMLEALIELGCHVTLLPDNRMPDPAVHARAAADGRRGPLRRRPRPTSCAGSARACRWRSSAARRSPVAGSSPSASSRRRRAIVYDTVDLHWLREARRAAIGRRAGRPRFADAEGRGPARARAGADPGQRRDAGRHRGGARAGARPTCPGARSTSCPTSTRSRARVPRPQRPRPASLFVGGFEHPPNVDGALDAGAAR